MIVTALIFVIAIIAIYFGAQWLIEGASEMAAYLGVPPLVIGLTIVALGTSLPEFVLGVMSGLEGVGSLSVGNVIGANISNATYIIGACAILTPIIVRFEQIRREALFMLAALLVLLLFAYDGAIGAIEGTVMIAIFVLYLVLLVRSLYSSRPSRAVVEEFEAARPETEPPLKSMSFILVGAAILIIATDAAVRSATEVATILGMSEFLIGITIVTFGTTTPEFATSILAAYRKRADIVVGNTLGTLVFNSVFVLGIGAVIKPLTLTDGQIMLGILPLFLFGALLAGIVYRQEGIGRWEGVGLVALYILYMAVLLSYG